MNANGAAAVLDSTCQIMAVPRREIDKRQSQYERSRKVAKSEEKKSRLIVTVT